MVPMMVTHGLRMTSRDGRYTCAIGSAPHPEDAAGAAVGADVNGWTEAPGGWAGSGVGAAIVAGAGRLGAGAPVRSAPGRYGSDDANATTVSSTHRTNSVRSPPSRLPGPFSFIRRSGRALAYRPALKQKPTVNAPIASP